MCLENISTSAEKMMQKAPYLSTGNVKPYFKPYIQLQNTHLLHSFVDMYILNLL